MMRQFLRYIKTGAIPRVALASIIVAVLVVFSIFAALQYQKMRKQGARDFPSAGESLLTTSADLREHSQAQLAGLDGFIVWSSNRSGNHNIYLMALPMMDISQITNHPHTEYFPRVSPDGERILFQRSRQPWVSQRNLVDWDLYLLDLNSGAERKLASKAGNANWLNGREITYLDHGVDVTKLDIVSGKSERLFGGSGGVLGDDATLFTPEHNPYTAETVFTTRQAYLNISTGHWGTALAKGDTLNGIHEGCQISWSSDFSTLYQVATGGIGKTQVMRVDSTSRQATPWFDLAGEFDHEYWPKDANVEASELGVVVLGASRGDHEHDVADYEIFLLRDANRLQGAAVTPIRLTFHTGNDNWPDIYLVPDRKPQYSACPAGKSAFSC